MQPGDPAERLSRITTLWGLVAQAHEPQATGVGDAQRRVLERYGGCVHRYLLGALRDSDGADELFQEFVVRFLRGGFRNASPERGRFRDYVKTALFNLVNDHHQRRNALPKSLTSALDEPIANSTGTNEADQAFLESWREQLMDRTWLALAEFERVSAQPYHTILRFRTDYPLLSSADLAAQVGKKLQKSYSVDAVRQALHRAREKFAELLVKEVLGSIQNPTNQRLQEELAELGLLNYCRSALEGLSVE